MRNLCRCVTVLAVGLVVSMSHARVDPPARFEVFPPVIENSQSFGRAISSNGYAAADRAPTGVTRFVPGTGFQNLGRPLQGINTGVMGINSAGVLVGTTFRFGTRIAYRYDDGRGFSAVTTGSVSAVANAISDTGFITGSNDSGAFLHSPGTGLVTIGSSTQAGLAVNELGQVAGFGSPSGFDRAFVYTPGSGVQYLSPPSSSNSYARGINDAGQVLIEARGGGLNTAGGYIYTPGAGYRLLPQTAGVSSSMSDINNLGWVVGTLNSRGTLWVPGESSPVDLTAYIQTYFGGSYIVESAAAVNDARQIVGTVKDSAFVSSAFILTIPSPGALGLFAVVLSGAARRRRRVG